MTDIEKLRVLLPHWITHNKEHGTEFVRWAESCEDSGNPQIAEKLQDAVRASAQVTKALEQALAAAGGAAQHLGSEHAHGHGHGTD